MGDYKLSAGNYPASAMSENRARFDGYSSDAASADSVKANEILAGIKAAGKSKQDEARTYITTNGVLKPGVKKDSGRKATKKVGKTTRIVLDVALTLMLVFEMFIQYTGAFLHEVIGFALFATIAAHMALSAKWVKGTVQATQKGKLGGRHAALAVVGCLLAVTTVALGLSSVAISSILYSAGFVWPIGTYAAWATVHAFSAYALCALVVVHLAMHWAFLASAFKVPYDPSRRRAISTGVNVLAGLGVVALGIAAAGTMTPQVSSAAQGAGNSGGTSAGATVSSQANAMPGASDLLASDAGSAASQPAAVASEITTAS
ncbi:MAG: DUF4405 domain-containing protein, partial [Eggerthellaceae bacterium]|nr:DUF4405 domain-containing protein [Eggerthellaceae bacterium]